MKITEIVIKALENEINLYIIISIFILATLDLTLKKDLKSQIVSLGVLGTFIGIFMGLQNFNPEDMKNSINGILLGLKTAFFTSIVGMSVALILAIIEKLYYKEMDNSSSQENLLLEISNKLNNLENLDTNFAKMNNSLEIAIDKLSKGATEEIIKALEQVIQEFNQELQSSFGDNFVKLNEAVINLLEWQENYKTHIEHIEKNLNISTSSIEKSKESLEIISSKNEDVLKVYQELKQIINIYDRQINELTQHLETYSNLSSSAENMFLTIKQSNMNLTNNIKDVFEEIKESFDKNRAELNLVSAHFKNLGEQIPKALEVSLNELNRGLTSITRQFKKDYEELLDKHKKGLNE